MDFKENQNTPPFATISHADIFELLVMATITLQENLYVSWAWGKESQMYEPGLESTNCKS